MSIVEAKAFEELRLMAEAVANDVSQMDIPGQEGPIDTSYDLYVEKLDGLWMGLIDMGEYYQQAFVYTDTGWEHASDDPYLLEERILKQRGFGG